MTITEKNEMQPVIIYCCTGIEHLVYCIWSIRSLRLQGYEAAEVLVNQQWEKAFIEAHLGEVSCEVSSVDRKGYGLWAFRPFALEQYTIKHGDRDVVICDTDVLWKKDPMPLFSRFHGKAWVHKITSLNPSDLDMEIAEVPMSRVGLRTMLNYKNRHGLGTYPNFHLNCGLFMLPKDQFPDVLKDWVTKIRALPPKEMIMTEALLSLTYTEKGISPSCDRQNIKHLGIHHSAVSVPVVAFEIADAPDSMFTGYETARHYFSDQRKEMHEDAVAMGLDPDNLLRMVKKDIMIKKMRKLPQLPARLINKLKNRSARAFR